MTQIKLPTILEYLEVKGPVKQVMQAFYRAHSFAGTVVQGELEFERDRAEKNMLLTFDEKGRLVHELDYHIHLHYENLYENGVKKEQFTYNDNKLYQRQVFEIDKEGRQIACVTYDAEGKNVSKWEIIYRKDGKQTGTNFYYGEDLKKMKWDEREFDERGNLITLTSFKEGGVMERKVTYKWDDNNKQIEIKSVPAKGEKYDRFYWTKNKYNQQGDCIESTQLNEDGSVEKVSTYTHEYDSEGKRILPKASFVYNPYKIELEEEESEEYEYDARGNWTKRTIFYENLPTSITVREYAYFDDPVPKTLVHPCTKKSVKSKKERRSASSMELNAEDARWIAETPNSSQDMFPVYRYYTMKYKEPPSGVHYNGPNIEALNLLEELKRNFNAVVLHTSSGNWNFREKLIRYTLDFPDYKGYMLQATGITDHDSEEFSIPNHIKVNGVVGISSFYLFRPSDASGKRDEFFEEYLEDSLERHTLRKKPDKPTIHMIEVRGTNFSVIEHPVNDDFEIRDLDVHYGYGFQKFHDDLMHRFHTQTTGLVLFHGQPGTGKTYYIRHLLRKMVSKRKIVIYMPPNMVDHLVDPAFMTFLSGEIQQYSADGFFCVLLIEDAEPLLAKRQEGVRIQGVTNLLNMSDGLLNDMLKLQIICTFNVDLRKLDSALLRPGRLIARKEFKPLSVLDANLLAQRLGIKHHFDKPATLAEVYALRKDSNTLIHDVDPDRDASTILDDL